MAYVCVECGAPVALIYRVYSRGNISLQRCDECGAPADRYVEYQTLLVCIDILLHRQAAYRHVLFNRLPASQQQGQRHDGWAGPLVRLLLKVAIAVLFFDTYVMWALTRSGSCDDHSHGWVGWLSSRFGLVSATTYHRCVSNIHHAEWRMLVSAAGELAVYLWLLCVLTRRLLPSQTPSALSVLSAALLSMHGKLGVLLLMVWGDGRHLAHMAVPLQGFVALANTIALNTLVVTAKKGSAEKKGGEWGPLHGLSIV
ncbi:unnamed protein product [Vitrella brassicaformis CCMP3155]|uniref:Protein ARV n=1 Tax=Vitrella brassicaformis (strain CCMP3155) TaxID=1169540 RepID=A0A0G4ESN7_VITBC|nr:unnamed protein product [Vitrella brassicaformis CCMP3155]|eukprot:CEM01022.1 unnamed protein product [Vitrella brassicaformis CCMP3155]